MALPASMTTAKTSSNTFSNNNGNNDNGYQSNEGKSRISSQIYGGEKKLNSQNDRIEKKTSGDYDNEVNKEEIEGDEEVEEGEIRDIDDDEVLRILSLLGEEEEEEEEEGGGGGGKEIVGNGNDILRTNEGTVDEEEVDEGDDDDDYEDYEDEGPIDPSKQLQQRLKGVYSRSKGRGRGRGSGRGSLIGDVVFDIVDNKGRVRDIRKSQLSDSPSALKVSLFSSPLTELSGSDSRSRSRSRSEKSNIDTSYSSTAYQSGSNKKAGGTVADALEALKNPLFMPPKSRESSNNRGTGVTGIPGESIVSTNSRLRALATRPVGGSYEGEEVDRALR